MPSNEKMVLESAGTLQRRSFTTGEAADYCKVSQQTIIREIDKSEGGLPALHIPGSKFRVIYYRDLIRFMKQNGLEDIPDPQEKILAIPIHETEELIAELRSLLLETLDDTKLILNPDFKDGLDLMENGGMIFRENQSVEYDPIAPYRKVKNSNGKRVREYHVAEGKLADALTHYFQKHILRVSDLFVNGENWEEELPHAVRRN